MAAETGRFAQSARILATKLALSTKAETAAHGWVRARRQSLRAA
jgi:hypothetical protein